PHSPDTVLYTLSLHDALPICRHARRGSPDGSQVSHHMALMANEGCHPDTTDNGSPDHGTHDLVHHHRASEDGAPIQPHDVVHGRSEEHTSELQSRENLVCRLL